MPVLRTSLKYYPTRFVIRQIRFCPSCNGLPGGRGSRRGLVTAIAEARDASRRYVLVICTKRTA
jgi:hypothetical protein